MDATPQPTPHYPHTERIKVLSTLTPDQCQQLAAMITDTMEECKGKDLETVCAAYDALDSAISVYYAQCRISFEEATELDAMAMNHKLSLLTE